MEVAPGGGEEPEYWCSGVPHTRLEERGGSGSSGIMGLRWVYVGDQLSWIFCGTWDIRGDISTAMCCIGSFRKARRPSWRKTILLRRSCSWGPGHGIAWHSIVEHSLTHLVET